MLGHLPRKGVNVLKDWWTWTPHHKKISIHHQIAPKQKKRVLNPDPNLLWVKNERRLSPDEMQCCGSPPLSAQLPFCPIFNIGANFRACLLPSYKLFPFTINMMWKVCELVILRLSLSLGVPSRKCSANGGLGIAQCTGIYSTRDDIGYRCT